MPRKTRRGPGDRHGVARFNEAAARCRGKRHVALIDLCFNLGLQ